MPLALLGLHAALAVAAPLAARRLGRRIFLVCGAAPLLTVLWAATRLPAAIAGEPVHQRVAWVGQLGLRGDLLVDAFAILMLALVSGIGTLIFAYSYGYFASQTDAGMLGRFAGRLTAFAGAMTGLVIADNLLVLYVFWELTSITSYLLIGIEDTKGSSRAAALQALLITTAGGLAMLAGFVLLGQSADTYRLSAILASPPTGAAATLGVLLTLVGAFTKSAQVPFHMWLPAAMVAPTPVSAYLHSATMVKAGVYLIARMAPAFAPVTGWQPLVVGVGVATMLVGGWRALRQHDLKLLLAFGTVSQLGFMVALFGVGVPEATTAGATLLVAHGLFKAALFMTVGIIDHQTHTRDLRRLSGVGRRMPGVAAVAVISAASMAGLPPLIGFVSKEAAYEAYLHAGAGWLGPLALTGLVAGSVLTFAYSFRFVWGGFATKPDTATHGYAGTDSPPPTTDFLAPAGVLAALTVAFGLVPGPLSGLVYGGAGALDAGVEPDRLALWHGINPALGLSLMTIAAGVALCLRRHRFEQLQERVWGRASSQHAYHASVRGVNRIADRVTGVVQNGSLPTYLAVILLTAVALPSWALAGLGLPPVPERVSESPLQALVGVGIMLAALGTIYARKRFTGVLFLGGVGYGVAVLFIVQGAPDLALTQFLIETLSLVIFVLVLRHLPADTVPRRWPLGQNFRRVVAASVGVFVFGFALYAGAARTQMPVSTEFLTRSLPEAGGKNIVNVILVDFRGFDTFGEITVLAVAALGIASLVRASRPLKQGPTDERTDRESELAVATAGDGDRSESRTPVQDREAAAGVGSSEDEGS